MEQKKVKVVSLYSGGLDSILAIKILLKAAINILEIIPVRFTTPFFNYKNSEEFDREKKYLKECLGLDLRMVNITEEFLNLLDNPKYGFGKNLNPCIDCKILMLKTSKKIMEQEGAAFVVSGEVAGQRPMSQQINQMGIIEKEAGLEGVLLRPLSALLLNETMPEKEGLVDRVRLLGIKGRSRKQQMELVKSFGLRYFTTPSGGCLLTDIEYARKLKILKNKIRITEHLLNCLRWGRVYLIKDKLLIVGRNEFENKKLFELAEEHDLLIQPKDIPGPLAMFIGGNINDCDELAANICASYIKGDFEWCDMEYGNVQEKNKGQLIDFIFANRIKARKLKEVELSVYKT